MRMKIRNSNAGSPNTPTRAEGTVADICIYSSIYIYIYISATVPSARVGVFGLPALLFCIFLLITTHPVTQISRIYRGHPKTTFKSDPLPNGHFNCLGAKPRPKRPLLGAISATIWGQAEHEKIVLSCGFWQGSEGWRHFQIDEFSKTFCACFPRAI